MNIALMSDEHRQELMVQFCIAYCGIGPKNEKYLDDMQYICQLCDQNNIPYATNLGTAEMLIQGLARGDLDWRDIIRPQKRKLIL